MKRFLTCFLAAIMLLSGFSLAYAGDDGQVKATADGLTFTENSGSLIMTIKVTNPYKDELVLAGIQPSSDSAIISAAGEGKIMPRSEQAINITAALDKSSSVSGSLTFYFDRPDFTRPEGDIMPVTTAICSDYFIKRTPSEPEQEPEQEKEDSEFCLRTSNKDANGICVPTPSGDYGDEIEVRLPLVCTRGSVYDIQVSPVLNTDIEKFPFDINLVDYTLNYPNSIGQDQVVEFRYLWRLSKKATMGVKQVDFNVSYRTGFGGEKKTGTVSLFVNVRKGLTPQTGDATASVPKLIIESYTLSPEKIYAGETFGLEFTVRNTSSSETIKNIQIRIRDAAETATIVPASGGSNTIYISKISKDGTDTQKLSLQTAPDAEAKAYTLNLDFSYESASTNAAHEASESIAVPILQKIRLKCDAPVIYDEMAWVGTSCPMYVKMYNMGRSTIYNCTIDVEGQGLKMEESYFGGNLSGGSTLSADFSIIASEAGNIEGNIILSYEDVYGEASQEKLPFTLLVEEQAVPDDSIITDEGTDAQEPEHKGMPWWGWTLIGGGVLGGGGAGAVAVKKLRRHRKQSLEDDI